MVALEINFQFEPPVFSPTHSTTFHLGHDRDRPIKLEYNTIKILKSERPMRFIWCGAEKEIITIKENGPGWEQGVPQQVQRFVALIPLFCRWMFSRTAAVNMRPIRDYRLFHKFEYTLRDFDQPELRDTTEWWSSKAHVKSWDQPASPKGKKRRSRDKIA